jgi:cytochrome c biogenesis protein CcmG/thiol:disulfide interchange protein DsbE
VNRLFFLVPVVVVVALGVLFLAGLNNGSPTYIPSGMVGKPAPDLGLPAMDTESQGFTRDELGKGKPILVNFWASWCIPCRIEHPTLQALSAKGEVELYGIDYKDDPKAARGFLKEFGDPYQKIDSDKQGRVSIDWGVTGVPETFVVDANGVIRAHYAGPLTEDVLQRVILPAMAQK